ncbi:hypothetical protein EV426DRAFT_661911 [Tirmania nivea]|nr:hypothetical protein EV426DRAFT_661911 [Tirmania nivea]
MLLVAIIIGLIYAMIPVPASGTAESAGGESEPDYVFAVPASGTAESAEEKSEPDYVFAMPASGTAESAGGEFEPDCVFAVPASGTESRQKENQNQTMSSQIPVYSIVRFGSVAAAG